MQTATGAIAEYLGDYEEPTPGVEALLADAERWLTLAMGERREECCDPTAAKFTRDHDGWALVVIFEVDGGPFALVPLHVDEAGFLDVHVDEARVVADIRAALNGAASTASLDVTIASFDVTLCDGTALVRVAIHGAGGPIHAADPRALRRVQRALSRGEPLCVYTEWTAAGSVARDVAAGDVKSIALSGAVLS